MKSSTSALWRHKYGKRSGAALFAALLSLWGLTPAAEAVQKITITVPSVEVSDAGYFVAVQKGYFAAEGLDVDLVFAGGGTATPGLLSGTIDGSASPASALSAIMRGAPLRIVLIFTSSPTYKLWAIADIHSLADLKGKSIGIATRGDTYEIATRLALKAAGVPPDSVGYTPLGFGAAVGAAFGSGSLSAVVLSTSAAVAMQEQGELKTAHVIADYFGKVHMPWDGFAMSEREISGDPILAKKVVRAIVKGMRYTKAFKDQAIAVVGKYQKVPHPHASAVDYDEFMRALTPDYTVGKDVIASDLEVRAGLLNIPADKIPPIAEIYDFSIIRAVNAELDASHWKPTP